MKILGWPFALFTLLLSFSARAATAHDGFTPNTAAASAAPHFELDGAAIARAVATAQKRKENPLQFAVGAGMPLELADGHWTVLDDGTAQWQLRLGSRGAQMLSVNFSKFRVPADARLYLYDAAGAVVQGPYTAVNETAEGSLSTAVVPGDEAVLELRVPNSERDQVQLKLGHVYHAFRSFSAAGFAPKVSGINGATAASCETNVVCAAGDSWRNPIRSTGLIQIGDGNNLLLCSGDLVNNVREDDTAYFLTAHHCDIGTSGYSASSVVVYWDYQADACTGTTASLSNSQTGSVLEGTDAGSDFALIKLNQAPSSDFNVYFAGWDASGAGSQSGVGIHHPEADIKKISTYSTPVSQQMIDLETDNGGNQTVQAWEVTWSSGITEEGSSGSGLWNPASQIIGVLSGGNSACTSSDPSDTSSTGNDYYGRLDVAWQASSSSSGQLKAWLDPDNTGTLVLDGKNPGTTGTTSGTTTGSSTTGSASGGTTGSSTTGSTTGGTTGGTSTGGTTGSTAGSGTTSGTTGATAGAASGDGSSKSGALPPIVLLGLFLAALRRRLVR